MIKKINRMNQQELNQIQSLLIDMKVQLDAIEEIGLSCVSKRLEKVKESSDNLVRITRYS